MMRVGILGGGQLGMMLGEAAKHLDISCTFLDPNADACAKKTGELIVAKYDDPTALKKLSEQSDVITYEFENVSINAIDQLEQLGITVYPSRDALWIMQDRQGEKNLCKMLDIPTAPFASVETREQIDTAIKQIGIPCILKTRREGYDGKGQRVIRSEKDAEAAWNDLEGKALILEGFVDFDCEMSIIAARNTKGETRFYPLIENEHRHHILHRSLCPSPRANDRLNEQAQAYARKILDHLQYIGVLTIECFVKDNTLIVNELAPRVHNSGHLTIEAANTSQFTLHLQSIFGLPLGSTNMKGFAGMINVVGSISDLSSIEKQKNIFIHAYGKEPREGRKLGHITVVAAATEDREMLLKKCAGVLGLEY